MLVQHHPSRAGLLPGLLERLPGAEVVSDPEPDGVRNPWRCYLECLRRGEGSDVVIVQDDALPCRDFGEAAGRATEACPGRLVSFYTGGPCRTAIWARQAMQRGESWSPVCRSEWLPTVALFWPAEKIELALRWTDRWVRPNDRADDGVLGRWMHSTKQEAWVTVPCLVDHPDVAPSLIRGRSFSRARTAAVAVPENPLSIVW